MPRIFNLAIAFVFLAASAYFGSTVTANPSQSGIPGEQPGYELLHPEASWCGPRVLYFFSIYLGHPTKLDDVVLRCGTDADGLTSLADLSGAAEALGLVPTPVQCTVEDLADFNGPAIVSIARQEGPVHFVGFLRREEEKFVILDPSRSVRTYRVSGPALEQSFTGHAVLLGEAGRLRVRWLSIPSIMVLAVVWIAIIAGCLWPESVVRVWNRFRFAHRERNDAR